MQVIRLKIVVNDDNIDVVNALLDSVLGNDPDGLLVAQEAESAGVVHPQVVDLLARINFHDRNRVILKNWLIVSPKKVHADLKGESAGFWSNEYGWTTRDAATRFELPTVGLTLQCGMSDAQFVPDDDQIIGFVLDGLKPYRLMLTENFSNQGCGHAPILFECWAEDFAHAEEQARDSYTEWFSLGSDDGSMLSLMRLREMGFDVRQVGPDKPSSFQWFGRLHDAIQKSPKMFSTFDEAIQDLTLHTKKMGMPFEVGSKAWWEEPDEGLCSGFGTVVATTGSILVLDKDDGGAVEAFACQCYQSNPRA